MYHVESRPCWNDCVFVLDVLDTCSWQADRDDCVEAQDFSDEGCDVGDFFLHEAFLPCIAVGVDFHYFVIGAFLDLLAVGG